MMDIVADQKNPFRNNGVAVAKFLDDGIYRVVVKRADGTFFVAAEVAISRVTPFRATPLQAHLK